MHRAKHRTSVALALAASGLAWPSLVWAVTDALQTPVQRALLSAWCGAGPQVAEYLGHCAACWIGASAFLAAALAVQLGATRRQVRLGVT